jgi:glycosyltransferase involved in cell wall biosynthesis
MVTIESMLAGVPVIASSLGGTSEILGYGQYGTLYHSGDISGLTDAMTEMLTDYKYKIEIAAKAKDYALQKFTAEIEIDLILKLLSNC